MTSSLNRRGPPWEHRILGLDSRVLGRWQETISLLKVAGRSRGRGPVRKSNRSSRTFSDFVKNLTAGRRQEEKVQNAVHSGKSPGWCNCSRVGLPLPVPVNSLRSYFQHVAICTNPKNILLDGRIWAKESI